MAFVFVVGMEVCWRGRLALRTASAGEKGKGARPPYGQPPLFYETHHGRIQVDDNVREEAEGAVHMVCSCGQPGQTTRCPSGTVSGQRPEPCKGKTQNDPTCIVVLSLEEAFD